MIVTEVYIEHPIKKIDQTFSYESQKLLKRGIRVVVDFNNQELIGFVNKSFILELSKDEYEKEKGYQIKPIKRIIDNDSLLNDELWGLGQWLSFHFVAPMIACYQAMLPNKLSPKSSATAIKYEEYVVFNHKNGKLSEKQLEALTFLEDKHECLRSTFRKKFSVYIANVLEDKKNISVIKKEARYHAVEIKKEAALELTKPQERAFKEIIDSKEKVILLHGATGSGKTELYLQLAQRIINQGKQVLILVPEIGLTPQMVKRVESRFGNDVAIYHSKLNNQERYEQFMRVKEHQVQVVVGTRSAIFMPFDNLGLIVIDEEHDHSYKQMNQPYYHCRDVAKWRANYHNCQVLLGSATPSLESYSRALKGNYKLVSLLERVNAQPLPKCHLIDVAAALKKRDNYIVTKPLREAIQERLDKHEQVIILLNRRGYDPVLRCTNCFKPITCPNCDLAMNYHKDINKLVCHTCGSVMDVPDHCDECGSTNIRRIGYGTQRLEEELIKFFPQCRIIRMDADSVTKKNSHEELLERFGNHEADILIGTQMIAKGLDYPKVTLVGVLNADALLARNDFRAVETTFDLIVQASGRSGRANDVGEVYIQSFDVNHYGIRCASHHDYLSFFKEEMNYRHLASYPPYTYLCCLTFTHKYLDKYLEALQEIYFALKTNQDFIVLGPSDLVRTFDKQRKRIIIKSKNEEEMINEVNRIYNDFIQKYPQINVICDVNPIVVE